MTIYTVSAGQTTADMTLNPSDFADVYGVASNTVVSGGDVYVESGGTANGASLDFGNLYVNDGGIASGVIVNFGGDEEVSGGVTSGDTVNYGGLENINSGGLAVNAVVNSGGVLNINAGGEADALTINSGGELNLEAGGVISGGNALSGAIVSGLLLSAGSLDEGSGAYSMDGVTLQSGAIVGLEVASGAVTSNFIINSGGYETVDSGGSAIGSVLEGGALEFAGSASAATTVIFNDTAGGGMLLLDDAANFSGALSGFGLLDGIDLTNVSNVADVTWNNGVLDIALADGSSLNYAMPGNYQSASFGFASDNNNGTLITLQSIQTPALSAVSYDAGSGLLTLSGSYLSTLAMDYQVSDLTLQGDGGNSYTLGNGSQVVGLPTDSSVSIQLSAADQFMVNGLLNAAGTQAGDGSSYGLSAVAGWDASLSSDISNTVVTVSNAAVPMLSAVSYNAATGVFTVTGSQLVNPDAGYGLSFGAFSFSGGTGSYTFDINSDTLSNFSANGFTLSLSGSDRLLVNQFVDANGDSPMTGAAYNLAAPNGWDGDTSAAIATQAVSVNNIATPAINTVTYDASTGILTIDGANLTGSAGDYNVSDFTLLGDGGGSYTLGNASTVLTRYDSASVSIQLSVADQFAVDGLLNNQGTQANDGTVYNLAAASNWDSGASAVTAQAVNVSNVTAPAITAVSYDAVSGVFTVSGGNLVNAGGNPGLVLGDFSFGGGSGSLQFSFGNDSIGNLGASSFTITLNSTDKAAVSAFINADGDSPLSGAAYNFSAVSGWDSDSGSAISTQSVSVSGLPTPQISSVAYNAASGVLTLNGSGLSLSAADYKLADFTLSGDSGNSYVLGSSSVISVATDGGSASIQLSAADQQAVDGLLNNDGATANSGASYQFSTGMAWDNGYGAATSAAISVSNVTAPAITAVSYNAASGVFSVTGNHLVNAGVASAINLADFSFSGGGGGFSFSASHDTLGNFSANGFSITLNTADKTLVNAIVNANGSSPLHGAAYNFAASANWDSDSGAAISNQAVTAAYVATPTLDTASYNAASGLLTLSGQNMTLSNSDYTVSDFTLSGDGGAYTLGVGSSVAGVSAGSLAIQLSAADQLAVDGLLNKAGTAANDSSVYNLMALSGWDSGASSIGTLGVAVSNVSAPLISSVSYNAASGVFSFGGSHLVNTGGSIGIAAADFTFSAGSHSFTFNSSDSIGNLSASGFNMTLSAADAVSVNALVTANGGSSLTNAAYSLSAAANWDSDSGAAINSQTVSASGVSTPLLSAVSYNAATGVLTLVGSDFTTASSDYRLANFVLKGDHGLSYTLTSASTMTNATANSVSILLSAADQLAVGGLLNQNGNQANDGGSYLLSTSLGWDSATSPAYSTGITVSNVTEPVITSVSYNAATGVFSFTGSHLVNAGSSNGLLINDFSFGDDGGSYGFNSGDTLGKLSATGFSVTLGADDKLLVNALVDANGGHDLNGVAYNISTTANWDGDSGMAIATQAVTVNNAPPVLTVVGYNAVTGVFSFSGVDLSASALNLNDFSLSSDSGSFSFTPGTDIISNADGAGFTVTLGVDDWAAVNSFLNQDGNTSLTGGAYSFVTTSGWDGSLALPVNTLAVNVSGAAPVITDSSYNAASGVLTLSGANLTTSAGDYTLADISLQGDGGATYTLSSGSQVVGTPAIGSVNIQLSAADQLAVDGLLNNDGSQANDGAVYTVAATNGWDGSSGAVSSAGVSVSNVSAPTLASVSFNGATGVFTFSGENLVNAGGSPGINLGYLTLSSDVNDSYSFDPNNDTVSNLSPTGFTVTLNSDDLAMVDVFVNLNGVQALNGSNYSISANSGWDSDSGNDITSLPVTAQAVPPALLSTSYDAGTGILTCSGANLITLANSYNLADFTLQGDGGNSYTLSAGSTIIGTPTSSALSIQLSVTDQLAVNGLLNSNGSTANDGYSSYTLSTVSGWDTEAAPVILASPLVVGNVVAPVISAVSYDAATGVVTVTGSHFSHYGGSTGINLGNFTLNGGNGGSLNLSSDDTVSSLSANSFSVMLSSADKETVDRSFVTANGLKPLKGAAYTLSVDQYWDGDIGDAISNQVVSVKNVLPNLDSVSYDASSGQLTLTGNYLTNGSAGYKITDFSLSGDGGHSYKLTAGSKISVASTQATQSLTIQLSKADQLAVDGLLNTDGDNANDGSLYNLAASKGWDTAATAISTLAVNVSNTSQPSLTDVQINAATGVISFTGANLTNDTGIAVADFTLSGGNGGSYTFKPGLDVVGNSSATGFNITLSKADLHLLAGFVNNTGDNPYSGDPYNLAVAANWDSDSGQAVSNQSVTVSNGAPDISTASYQADSGILTLTGGFLTSTSSNYKVSDFSLMGDGGRKYTLSAASKLIATPVNGVFSIQLSAADQLAVDGLLNRNGNQAGDGGSYNLMATAGWDTGATAITSQPITVSNVSSPLLTGVSYNAAKGVFSFIGANLFSYGGGNGITLSDLKLEAGSASYALSSKDTVSQLSANGFTVTLSAADKASVNALANANGLSPLSGAAYSLNASANWDSDSGAAISNLALTVNNAARIQTLASAGLSHPDAVAVDGNGDVFIASAGNSRLDELVAGGHSLTALSAFNATAISGLALDSSGDLFIANATLKTVDELVAGSSQLTRLASGLNSPAGMAMDSAGNLYFADTGNNSIDEIHAGTHSLQILVANNLKAPGGVVVDAAGDVFFTDTGHNAIKELLAGTGSSTVTTLLSSGLKAPTGLCIDGAGNLYVTETGNNSIVEIAAGSQIVSTVLNSGLNKPTGISVDANGNLYVTDTGNNAIKELVHASYVFDTSLSAAKPLVIGSLWENTGQIELSKSVFTAFAGDSSSVSSTNFSNSATATGVSDYLYYNAKTGGLYYDGNGTVTEIAIIGSSSHPAALSAGDFKLIS